MEDLFLHPDIWSCIQPFLNTESLHHITWTSKSMCALVWKTIVLLDFVDLCTTPTFLEYLPRCPQIKGIDVRKLETDALVHLTNLKSLTRLWFPQANKKNTGFLSSLSSLKILKVGFSKMKDPTLISICNDLPRLTYINLSATRITGAGLAHISRLEHLEALKLWNCESIGPSGFHSLGNLPQLRDLTLTHCEVNDGGLCALQHLTNLTKLRLSSCKAITSDGIIHIRWLTNLQRLLLARSHKISIPAIQYLRDLTQLRKLDLGGCSVFRASLKSGSEASLDGLAHLTNLLHLDLYQLGIKDLSVIQKFRELRFLDLCGHDIEESQLIHLKDMHNLKKVDISSSEKASGEGLKFLPVTVTEIGITSVGTQHISHLVNLTDLKCDLLDSHPTQDCDDTFSSLASMTKLTTLAIAGGISRDGLKYAQNLVQLGNLTLSKCQCPDASLAYISGLTTLRVLSFIGCPNLGGGSLAYLSQLHQLEYLDLSSCGTFKEEDFIPIKGLKNLEKIWIGSDTVTKEDLQKLEPGVKWDIFATKEEDF